MEATQGPRWGPRRLSRISSWPLGETPGCHSPLLDACIPGAAEGDACGAEAGLTRQLAVRDEEAVALTRGGTGRKDDAALAGATPAGAAEDAALIDDQARIAEDEVHVAGNQAAPHQHAAERTRRATGIEGVLVAPEFDLVEQQAVTLQQQGHGLGAAGLATARRVALTLAHGLQRVVADAQADELDVVPSRATLALPAVPTSGAGRGPCRGLALPLRLRQRRVTGCG